MSLKINNHAAYKEIGGLNIIPILLKRAYLTSKKINIEQGTLKTTSIVHGL